MVDPRWGRPGDPSFDIDMTVTPCENPMGKLTFMPVEPTEVEYRRGGEARGAMRYNRDQLVTDATHNYQLIS